MFRRWCLPWIVWCLYRLWTWTWRLEYVESDGLKLALLNGERLIFAHWHGDELCVVPLVTRYKIATMTSTSKDGQLIDFTIRRLGGATSRGSSTRGGVGALKGLVRLVREGYRASMAVDGPRGPLHVVKPGVFELSRLADAKIVSVGAATSNAIVFQKSWNKAHLPKPFAKVVVAFSEPWPAIRREDDAKSPELAQRLAANISKTCQHASEHLR
jgi:lysophospholipid acyltransferase (LPLAT)-like uncharacterized protein